MPKIISWINNSGVFIRLAVYGSAHNPIFITLLSWFYWLTGWYVCCILTDQDLWKKMLLKCSITMGFTCPLLSSCQISSYFRENNNVAVFQFPFHILMTLACLWFILLQFPILRTISCNYLYTLIRPPSKSLVLVEGIHAVPSYVSRFRHCQSLPLEGVDRVFTSEDSARRHFLYLSGNFRELFLLPFSYWLHHPHLIYWLTTWSILFLVIFLINF